VPRYKTAANASVKAIMKVSFITLAILLSTIANANDWLVIPHQQVGEIKAGWTVKQFRDNMPATSYIFKSVPGPEGTEHKAIVVFPNTINEVEISFDEQRQILIYAKIRGLGSNWHTINGIKIGSTANDVKKINNAYFSILGFDWDYAGQLSNTNGGSYKGPFLWFKYTGKMSPQFIGDKEINVSEFSSLSELTIQQMDIGLNLLP
jgi:hypothetical protein